MEQPIKLYDYWRSSAAYRVRIGLHLKEIPYLSYPVNLHLNDGEQHDDLFRKLNPSQAVPVLSHGSLLLTQSLVILQYLDDAYPSPRIIPDFVPLKYQVLALAQDIAMDIHPLNNLRVLDYLENTAGCDDAARQEWYRHWVYYGLTAIEEKLAAFRRKNGDCQFALSTTPSLVDVCLIPQIYDAQRYGVDIDKYTIIQQINDECLKIPAFVDAAPECQDDAWS